MKIRVLTVARHAGAFVALAAILAAMAACGGGGGAATSTTEPPAISTAASTAAPGTAHPGDGGGFTLTSSAFVNDAAIPAAYTCDGAGTSPPLAWSGVPRGTQAFALIIEDPDAPVAGGFTHWLAYGIPASATSLPAAIPAGNDLPAGGEQGTNGAGGLGYFGPCPPAGDAAHHYRFRLYALDAPLGLPAGASKADLLALLPRHTRGEADLVGLYKR